MNSEGSQTDAGWSSVCRATTGAFHPQSLHSYMVFAFIVCFCNSQSVDISKKENTDKALTPIVREPRAVISQDQPVIFLAYFQSFRNFPASISLQIFI